jgi:hypothetical protein
VAVARMTVSPTLMPPRDSESVSLKQPAHESTTCTTLQQLKNICISGALASKSNPTSCSTNTDQACHRVALVLVPAVDV